GGSTCRTASGNDYYRLQRRPDGTAAALESRRDLQPVGRAGPTVTVTASTMTPGGTVTVSWQGIVSPTTTDWIGLYGPSTADTAPMKWFFTATCTQTSGTAKVSGSCTTTLPTTAGTYQYRLFANNGYTKL